MNFYVNNLREFLVEFQENITEIRKIYFFCVIFIKKKG